MPDRPDLPLPPRPMPLLRGGRPLKRWRWVGAFGPDVMLCAAVAHVGPLATSWWAVWDREVRTLAEHTQRRAGAVELSDDHIHVEDGPVTMDLVVHGEPAVETVSPHGDQYIWTAKQSVRVTGSVVLADRAHTVDLRGLVDESAGYHARHTAWKWSAGVGVSEAGATVAWNLVDGVHDAPVASERTVWVDGVPHELPPLQFAEDLSAVGGLRFSSEAVRAREDNLLLLRSSYEQPFGAFSGELPVAGRLREGWGVMERHDVRW